jgi:hypothetical protein
VGSQNLELRNLIRNIKFQGPQVLASFLDHNPEFVYATSFVQLSSNFLRFVLVCSLMRKNIKRAKSKKKFGQKRKEKIVKEKRR